jgi:hypothetical protein
MLRRPEGPSRTLGTDGCRISHPFATARSSCRASVMKVVARSKGLRCPALLPLKDKAFLADPWNFYQCCTADLAS